jgi:hypothetical protein
MTTAWNTYASQTAVQEPPAQAHAWHAAPPQPTIQQPAFQQYPPVSGFNPQGGMPPQGPGFGGFNGFNGGQPPRPNRTPLIISLVVAAVLLIGGGVGAFFLLNKKSDPVDKAANVVTSQPASTSSNTISTPTDTATPTTPTSTQHPTTQHTPTSTTTDAPSTGGGDLATAQVVAQTWVDYINEGDIETAAVLVCQASQEDFISGFDNQGGSTQLEVVSVDYADSFDGVVLTFGAVGDTTGDQQAQVAMYPTNTGYFLICDGPLSATDLNWGA